MKWSAKPYAESVKLKHFDGEAVFHPGVPVSEAFSKYVPDAMPTDPDALAVRKEYVSRVQGILGDLAYPSMATCGSSTWPQHAVVSFSCC